MAKISKYEARERNKVLVAYNHTCAACGSTLDLQIDHVIPRSANGSDDFANLQVLCGHCNNRKNGAVGIPKMDPIELTAEEMAIVKAAHDLIQAKREAFVSYLDECKRLAK